MLNAIDINFSARVGRVDHTITNTHAHLTERAVLKPLPRPDRNDRPLNRLLLTRLRQVQPGRGHRFLLHWLHQHTIFKWFD